MLLYQETKLFNKGVEIFSSVSAKDYFLPYATVQGVFMALDFSPSFLPLSSVLTHLLIIVSALLLLLFLRRSWEAFGLFLIFMHLVFLILHQGEFIAPLAWYLWFPAWFLVLLILDSIRLYRSLFLLFMGISCYQAAELDVYLFPQGKETFHFVKKEAWLNLNKKPEPEKSNYFPYARAEWFLKKREHSIELILRLQKPLPGAEEFLLDPPFEGARSVQKEVKSSDEIQFVWPEKEIEHFSFQALKAPSQTLYLHWNNQVLVQDLTPGERFFPASMLPKKENLEIAASIQKLEVKSKQDFEIDQSRFNFKAQFSFTATNQEVLDFQLPQGLKISIVDGMELDWKQTENQLRLNFTSPQNAGSFRMEGSLITESRTEVMSLVELPEAWRSEHKIHLFAAPAITLKVQPAQASIGSVRLIEEIPDQDFVFERIIQGRKSEKASLIVPTSPILIGWLLCHSICFIPTQMGCVCGKLMV